MRTPWPAVRVAPLMLVAMLAACGGGDGDSDRDAARERAASTAATAAERFEAALQAENRRFRVFVSRIVSDIRAGNLEGGKSDAAQYRTAVFNFDGSVRKIRFPASLRTTVNALLDANRTLIGNLDALAASRSAQDFDRLFPRVRTDIRAAARHENRIGPALANSAARAAGCSLRTYRSEGTDHDNDGPFRYRSNPPHSGTHTDEAVDEGAFDRAPPIGQLVHALEHGRVILWYRPGDTSTRDALRRVFDRDRRHMVLIPNETRMPYEAAASAWTRVLGCRQMNDAVPAAARAFRTVYRDKAPEDVP